MEQYKDQKFSSIQLRMFFTDDTVMTLAIAEGLMNGGGAEDFIAAIKKYGRLYPDSGYGGRFGSWLFSDDILMEFRKKTRKKLCLLRNRAYLMYIGKLNQE